MNTYPLSKEDVKTLKSAHTLAFDVFMAGGQPQSAAVRAYSGNRMASIFDQPETTIPMTARVSAYKGFVKKELIDRICISKAHADFTPEITTIMQMLRVGDCLELDVEFNNTSKNMEDNGWTAHYANLRILRPTKAKGFPGGLKVLTFRIWDAFVQTTSQYSHGCVWKRSASGATMSPLTVTG